VRTRVETGQRRDAKVEIIKGLSIDDVVVIAGQIKLRDGVPVVLSNNSVLMRAAKADPADTAKANGTSGKPDANAVPPRS
jgi:membrane fusion protein, multidrug efflux system